MGLTLDFNFEDSYSLWVTAASSALFREEELGRFEPLRGTKDVYPDLLISSPEFDAGSVLWCETASDALLLEKLHRAAGHQAQRLWDTASGGSSGFVVLTTWNALSERAQLSQEEVFANVVFFSSGEELGEMDPAANTVRKAWAFLRSTPELAIHGEPLVKVGGSHLGEHLVVFDVSGPGTVLEETQRALSEFLERNVGIRVG